MIVNGTQTFFKNILAQGKSIITFEFETSAQLVGFYLIQIRPTSYAVLSQSVEYLGTIGTIDTSRATAQINEPGLYQLFLNMSVVDGEQLYFSLFPVSIVTVSKNYRVKYLLTLKASEQYQRYLLL
jgi:hypothetical protein